MPLTWYVQMQCSDYAGTDEGEGKSYSKRYCRERKMSTAALGRRLVTCLLNVPEARRADLVESVAKAALYDSQGVARETTAVLNIFNDRDYNRSVITIVAAVEGIGEAVLSACEKACQLFDMRAHSGVHPCLGAVDLVPIYPLGEDVGPDDCARESRAIAAGLTRRVPGTSVFLFGWADAPLQRGLAQRRKEMGWFRKTADSNGVGPVPDKRFGLTGIGASPYVMNCNVTIDTQDLSVGRRIAAALRESAPGGLPGVQVLALPHEGAVEIACNVESVPGLPPGVPPGQRGAAAPPGWPSFSIGGQPYCHVPASLIAARVAELADEYGVSTGGAVLAGFTPGECRALAEAALSRGMAEFWKERQSVRM
ncbi:formiminotransferase N-terminal subdomain-containing protein isoform 1-T1 [Syngnathus typhle]